MELCTHHCFSATSFKCMEHKAVKRCVELNIEKNGEKTAKGREGGIGRD